MVERLLLDRVDAEAGGSAVAGQHDLVVHPAPHETEAPLALVEAAVAGADVALDAAVGQRMPMPGRHGMRVGKTQRLGHDFYSRRVLLTLTTTHQPATDLGYLLVKHPDRVQSFGVTGGQAHVFYPEATAERCTAALLLDIDLHVKDAPEGFALGRYVNDRPYAASSLLSAAIAKVWRTALRGDSPDRPALARTPIPLTLDIPALRCTGGPDLARALFGPLGWTVQAARIPLDATRPDWGASRYLHLTLVGTVRLSDALSQVYVLLPVLDDAKHYWVAPDEVDKLLRAGTHWLATHPEKALIARRYLAHKRRLADEALARLSDVDAPDTVDLPDTVDEDSELPALAKRLPLAAQRREAVLAAVEASGASRVLDLGCGPGALLGALIANRRLTEIVGVDVSTRA